MITGTQKDIDRLLPFMTGRVKKALEAVRDLDLDAIPQARHRLTGITFLPASMSMRRNPLMHGVRKSMNATSISRSWQKGGRPSVPQTWKTSLT